MSPVSKPNSPALETQIVSAVKQNLQGTTFMSSLNKQKLTLKIKIKFANDITTQVPYKGEGPFIISVTAYKRSSQKAHIFHVSTTHIVEVVVSINKFSASVFKQQIIGLVTKHLKKSW